MNVNKLLEPVKIGKLEIKNRFVIPAMGTNYCTSDGFVTPRLIAYHTARAKGGYGLIITGETSVSPLGTGDPWSAHIYDEKFIPGAKELTDSVHAAGGKIFCQLNHAGRQAYEDVIGTTPMAPSAVPCPFGKYVCREMTDEEIWAAVEAYGDAAVIAKKAGYDGVEIHGAHGYLVAQFMSSFSNKRIDEWGGNLEGRMKFPREVIKNVRAKVGDDYPISFRMSFNEFVEGGITIEEATVIARIAEESGADCINVTASNYYSMEYMVPTASLPYGYNRKGAAAIKKAVNIPVLCVGRFNNVLAATDALEAGDADMICFGRASLADPELPNKLAEGRLDEQIPCIGCTQGCNATMADPEHEFRAGCLINPMTGHEFEYDMTPVAPENKKKVLVIGGGPGGLCAALTAKQRGHDVILCEATDHFGGDFRLAAVPPTKQEIMSGLKYYVHMCKKLGVDMRLNTTVDEAMIKEIAADAIILATGSFDAVPPIPGIHNDKFVKVSDVLNGKVLTGKNVLICGGGLSGCETADFLCGYGCSVTIIEMMPELAMTGLNKRRWLFKSLGHWMHNSELDSLDPALKVLTSAKILEFFDDGVTYVQGGEVKELRGFDTIMLAMGNKPNNTLEETCRANCKEVHVIGAALKNGNALNATETGFMAALKL